MRRTCISSQTLRGYFAHPQARCFSVGQIGRDRVRDYARCKGWTLAEAQRRLAPLLDYDPD